MLTLNLSLKQLHASVILGEVYCEIGGILNSVNCALLCVLGASLHIVVFLAFLVLLWRTWKLVGITENTLPYITGGQVRGCDNQGQSHPLLSSL